MREELGNLQKTIGITTVYVTHDQREAMALGDVIVVMKDGLLLQAGPPEELYEHPKTVFVGHFIGTPGMNFLNCQFRNGHLVMKQGGLDLKLTHSRHFELLKPYTDQELIVGIRPEYVEVSENHRTGETLAVKVGAVEPSGRYRLIDCFLGKEELKARIGWEIDIHTEESVNVILREDKLCVFDQKTELAIFKMEKMFYFWADTGERVATP